MKPIFKKTVAALLLSSFVGGQAWAISENDILFNCIVSPKSYPSKRLAYHYSLNDSGKTVDYLTVHPASYDTNEIFTMMNVAVHKNKIGNFQSADWLIMTIKNTNCIGSNTGTLSAGSAATARECALKGSGALNLLSLSNGSYSIHPGTDKSLFLSLDDGGFHNPSSFYVKWKKFEGNSIVTKSNQNWIINCVDMKGQPQSPPSTVSAF